jgi:serine/threonine-protein kinase
VTAAGLAGGNPTGAPTDTVATPATGPTAAAPTAPPAPIAPLSSLVKVRVNSDPDGASVKEDGVELCSSTPCDILYKGSDADPAREHRLTLSRSGYRMETKSVKVGDSPLTIRLTPAPVFNVRPAPQPKNDTAPVPTGYKNDIPY